MPSISRLAHLSLSRFVCEDVKTMKKTVYCCQDSYMYCDKLVCGISSYFPIKNNIGCASSIIAFEHSIIDHPNAISSSILLVIVDLLHAEC